MKWFFELVRTLHPELRCYFFNFQNTAFLLLYYSAGKKATLNIQIFNLQNFSATKYRSETVLYSKRTAGYPLSPHIKTIAVAFLQAE